MDHLTAAGLVAVDRGVEQGRGGITMRPRDGSVTLKLPNGRKETLSYTQLINEAERIKAAQPLARPPRGQHYSFFYPRPSNHARAGDEAA